MSSAVHFRFKSARDFDTVTFDGDFISIADLKVGIVEVKKLNYGEGFDLDISDAQTSDDYADEAYLLPKNTSVVVRRVPGLKPGGILSQQAMAKKNERYSEIDKRGQSNIAAAAAAAASAAASAVQNTGMLPDYGSAAATYMGGAAPKRVAGQEEHERIAALVDASGAGFERTSFPMHRGGFGGGYGGSHADRAPTPGPNYVCHRCGKPGHWIDQCPTNGDPTFDKVRVRRPTGIPQSMLRSVPVPSSGTGLQLRSGQFVTLQPNEEEFARQTAGLRVSRMEQERLAAATAAQAEAAVATGSNDVASNDGDGSGAAEGGSAVEPTAEGASTTASAVGGDGGGGGDDTLEEEEELNAADVAAAAVVVAASGAKPIIPMPVPAAVTPAGPPPPPLYSLHQCHRRSRRHQWPLDPSCVVAVVQAGLAHRGVVPEAGGPAAALMADGPPSRHPTQMCLGLLGLAADAAAVVAHSPLAAVATRQ